MYVTDPNGKYTRARQKVQRRLRQTQVETAGKKSLRAGGDRLCFEMCYCNESDSLQIVRFKSISVRRLASILWIALKTVL